MQAQTFLVLTVDEARAALVEFFADVLVNDRSNTVDLLAEGGLHKLPNLATMTADEVANQYGELCIAEKLLEENPNVEVVVVQVGERFEMAAMRGQLRQGKANQYPRTELVSA